MRENLAASSGYEDWVLSTGQQEGLPFSAFDPSGYVCGDPINVGQTPTEAEAYTIYSRDELQWDDGTVFTSVPFEGEAYNRRMDGETQAEADARTALKNPILEASLIFGNYDPVDIVGQKFETNLNGGNDGFSGVQFTLTGIDGMGNFVSLTDVTDTNGDFSFEGLKPGQYTITEAPITDVNNDGFDDVTGLTYDNRVFSVTATSGETIDAGDWFNYVSGSIHGVKFEDLDGDGRFDRDANSNGVFGDTSIQEEGLEGVVFDLYTYLGTTAYTFDPYSGVACTVTTHLWAFAGTATTNIHGEFWFSDLEPGQYVVRENLAASPGYEDWVLTTGQQEGLPFSAFDPSGYVCGDPINVGQTPTEADAYTIYSRDELQWDNDTAFTSAPFGGEAYNRRMDGETQAEADARTALKNPILQTSLIFGNYDPVDIVGQKFETNLNGSDDGFSGVQFTLTGFDGMGNFVSLTDVTDTNGDFSFEGLKPGQYTITEAPITDVNNDGFDDVTGLTYDDRAFSVDALSGETIDAGDWVNYVSGSIHGVKFEDLDGDGLFDRDASGDGVFGNTSIQEEGLEGVVFNLYTYLGTAAYTFDPYSGVACTVTTHLWAPAGTAITNIHGEFWFSDLEPGQYVVRENLAASSGYEDWVLSTGQQEGLPFSAFDPSGYVCGDPINVGQTPTEAEAYTIYSRDELQWDDGTVFTSVPFEGEAYNRRMDGETQAEADARTALKNPILEASLIFGNYDPVDIVGQKFETNLNGGNDGFSGVQFTLTGIDGMGNFVSLTDVTDTNGDFSFEGLKPGQYTITEAPITDVNNDGFDDVTGLTYDNRVFSVTATSGETIDAGDWFNYVSGSIHGVKFEDLDGDGNFDRDANSNGVFGDTSIQEEGLEGVVFDLYTYLGTTAYTFDPYSGVACTVTTHLWAFAGTATTNIHGEFWFSDLEPGQYVVRENLAASPGYEDWVLTTGQQEGLPVSTFDPSGYVCGDPINVGQTPTEADAYTIYSRDELQWDNDTAFTSAPFGGEAYNRRMDGETQAEADARTALKNPILQTSLIFGNYDPVDIVGQKFETNLNGSDDGFSGVQFTLTGFDGMGNFVSLTDVTDTNGDFSFEGLKPGQYTITEAPITDVNNDGFDDVTGLTYDDRAFSVDALSGETIDAGDWVNYVSGSIHGVKFEDLDGDGLFDRDASGDGVFGNTSIQEEGLEGVVFNLYTYLGTAAYTFDPYSGVACTVTTHLWAPAGTAITNIHGEFWFSDLEPGQYVVRENLAASSGYEDWVLSTGQQEGSPVSTFNPSGYVCGDPINVGQTPTEAEAYTIYSRDELQWDDGTALHVGAFRG